MIRVRLQSLLLSPALLLVLCLVTPTSFADEVFEKQVAPLLSSRCLQCHDTATKRGGLDLSTLAAARKGGESGAAIVPGNSNESLLWHSVNDEEMPKDSLPLTKEEKQLIKQWIDTGAAWTIAKLEPQAGNPVNKREDWVRRLTVSEYIGTVQAAVDVDIQKDAKRLLPADVRADGFSNTAYNLNVDLGHVNAYTTLAEIIVDRMDVKEFARRFQSEQQLSEEALRPLISKMGAWLLRGPLTKAEVASYLRIAEAVKKEGGDFEEAASFILEAMLQSPRFIYRMEDASRTGPVSDYELASRLSYTLWGAPPDTDLFEAAAKGELAGDGNLQNVRKHVERMLADPRAKTRSTEFIAQWLHLDRLQNLRPDKGKFPDFDLSLTADMRAETEAFFEEIAWKQNRPLADLFNAQVTFTTVRLARHYGLAEEPPLPFQDKAMQNALLARYTFEAGSGNSVADTSGLKPALNLTVEKTNAVRWQSDGLVVNKPTLIAASKEASQRLTAAIKKSGEITIVAWVTPAKRDQDGPARIVTLSFGTSNRNFTLGQEFGSYQVRFRTNKTDKNGIPSTDSPDRDFATQQTQLVYSRTTDGKARLYVNGNLVTQRDVQGSLSNWDENTIFALANETSRDRAWLGTFHRVEIYSKAIVSERELVTDQPRGQLERMELTDVPSRGGLLTQGSVLTVGGDNASMVARGLFVLHDVLRGEVSDPPPCVDTTPIPAKAGLSQRGIAEQRIADQSCGSCHIRFEPLAFGLEKYDGLGTFKNKDAHGNTLREDGSLLIPGADSAVPYRTSAELMDLLAGSERVQKTITWKLTQFALGRPLVDADHPELERIHAEAMQNGGTYRSLITAIVTSELVRHRQVLTESKIPKVPEE